MVIFIILQRDGFDFLNYESFILINLKAFFSVVTLSDERIFTLFVLVCSSSYSVKKIKHRLDAISSI